MGHKNTSSSLIAAPSTSNSSSPNIMRAVSIVGLSLVAGVLGAPSMSSRAEDWKIPLGWDGKTITLAEYQQSNADKSTVATRALSGGVYMCKDINWGGQCQYLSLNGVNDGTCLGLGNNFDDQVSSFGPDPGLRCTLYSSWACNDGWTVTSVTNPGIRDLSVYGFNDVMSGFRCWTL